jgi:hypothetical protein
MSGYRKFVDIPVTIEGAEYTVRLKSMTFEQSLSMSDAAAVVVDDTEAGKKAKLRAQGLAARRMLPGHEATITPELKDADGNAVSVQDIFDSAYFHRTATAIVTEWISKAAPANPS